MPVSVYYHADEDYDRFPFWERSSCRFAQENYIVLNKTSLASAPTGPRMTVDEINVVPATT
jgi:hypothetical protein